MLIQALTEYYDILAERGKVAKKGYSNIKVSYKIVLDCNGKIVDIIDIREKITDNKR